MTLDTHDRHTVTDVVLGLQRSPYNKSWQAVSRDLSFVRVL